MKAEHTQQADSTIEWTTGNYGVKTTSALEYWFVVDPDGNEAAAVRAAQRLRDAEARLVAAALRGDSGASSDEFEQARAELAALEARDGAQCEWPVEERLREPSRAEERRRPRRMDAFGPERTNVDAQLEKLGQPPISNEEFFGGRLYTGPRMPN